MFPKMLRVANEYYKTQVSVESKAYITVRIGKSQTATHAYWQLVDPNFSLLQLGFEWPSGRLVHCSVPLFNGQVEMVQNDARFETVVGAPFFDISMWPLYITEGKGVSGNVIEELGRIRLQRSSNTLSILASDRVPQRSILYGDAVMCHLDANDEFTALTLVGPFSI